MKQDKNRVLPRECTGHSKHLLPTTQEKTLHMDVTRWLTPKSDGLYSDEQWRLWQTLFFGAPRASLAAQRVKRLPGMQETRVRSLGWEDPLEKEMATQSSALAWRIPWTEEPGGLQSIGSQRVGHD